MLPTKDSLIRPIVQQYDCFDPTRLACPNGKTIFHEECVAGTTKKEEKRVFDTMEHQLAKNGDAANHVVTPKS